MNEVLEHKFVSLLAGCVDILAKPSNILAGATDILADVPLLLANQIYRGEDGK